MGRACTMISNIFLSLMVAGKCFVTRYAVKFVNIIWYTFDRIFCSPGIVKLCPVSGSTHISMYRVRRHLCFDGLKASRTFAIGLNSEIPRFTSHAAFFVLIGAKWVGRTCFIRISFVTIPSQKIETTFVIFHDQCNQVQENHCLQNRILHVNKLPWESSCLPWDREIDVKSVRLMANPWDLAGRKNRWRLVFQQLQSSKNLSISSFDKNKYSERFHVEYVPLFSNRWSRNALLL